MPEFIKNLLKRGADRIAPSDERCAASRESILLTTKVIVLSRQAIADSRAQIVRVGQSVGDRLAAAARSQSLGSPAP